LIEIILNFNSFICLKKLNANRKVTYVIDLFAFLYGGE